MGGITARRPVAESHHADEIQGVWRQLSQLHGANSPLQQLSSYLQGANSTTEDRNRIPTANYIALIHVYISHAKCIVYNGHVRKKSKQIRSQYPNSKTFLYFSFMAFIAFVSLMMHDGPQYVLLNN